MIIKIRVHAGSSREYMEEISEGEYEVWLKEKAIEGKANWGLIKFLKKEFREKLEFNDINIIKGKKSRLKIVELG